MVATMPDGTDNAVAIETIEQLVFLPGTPQQVYDALTDPVQHAAFTGADATGEPAVGKTFTAWGGYIDGTYLVLVAGHRIVQEWRTTEWPSDAAPSVLDITLEPTDGGCTLEMRQTVVPADQADAYRDGWYESYWMPLTEWLQGKGSSAPA